MFSKNRVEAFSDGVFAIAITLLILEVRLPGKWHETEHNPAGNGALWGELWDAKASLIAYAATFLLIGMIWINHHRMFHYIERVDSWVLGLNLLLLLDVAFLPFPTAVVADALTDHTGQNTAAILYGTVLTLGGVAFNAIWHYASSGHRLLNDTITPQEARVVRIRWWLGPVLYGVATLIALLSWEISLGCYIALLVFYYIDMRPRRRALQPVESKA